MKPRRLMVNRKGMELSINFIVMLILAIVVFGFGIYFVRNLFSTAQTIKASLSEDSQKAVLQVLDRGERVAMPVTSMTVKPGELALFGLGVLNTLPSTTSFYITVQCSFAQDNGGKDITATGCDPATRWTFDLSPISLKPNEKQVTPIPIQAVKGKQSGTYQFTVTVHQDSASGAVYGGSPKIVYVNIV